MAESSQANLLAFLRRQRWFGAKGGAPSDARILDSVVVPWGDGRFAIARVAVKVGDADQCYQLAIDTDGSRLDVTDDEAFRRGLVDALQRGASSETNGLRWVAEPTPGTSPIGDTATRLGSAEQSNTSIIAGDRAIIKLFRMLRPGIHPDVEVTRFLTTRAGFANTPRLLGEASLEKGGEVMTAAMMQELVPGASDAWSYALERGRPYFAAPKGRDVPNAFVDDARRLGEITRAMHDALASDDEDPAFAPEDVEPEDLDRWAHRAQQMIRDSVALLEHAITTPEFPKERLAEAQALVRRRDHYLGWINEIDDTIGDDVGLRIRVHGDYHLGQVLRSSSREFMVIDFEGEPSRSLAERREKTSALRDVAGMLRSFGYAAATLAMSVERSHDMATREIRVGRWERDVRAAFLDGYLTSGNDDDAGFLPEDPKHVRQLITLFEAEKAFYELAYELNNRPSWAWIPMRGITKLFVG
jgi:maltose alpha-D-glucosyltransferase/alpha-amylase